MRLVLATAVVLSLFTNPTMAEPTVKLHAAGSLKAAMSDIADLYEKTHGVTVVRAFGPGRSKPGRLRAATRKNRGQRDRRGGRVWQVMKRASTRGMAACARGV